MSERPKMRKPWDQSVANCMWLARLTDKTRLHICGKLDPEFEPFFGHRLATDGEFIRFFKFDLDELIAAVRATPTSDEAVAEWFIAQPGATSEQIAEWNEGALNLGRPGHPMSRAFSWAKRQYYGGENAHPAVVSVFSGIAWDEGYLEDLPKFDE